MITFEGDAEKSLACDDKFQRLIALITGISFIYMEDSCFQSKQIGAARTILGFFSVQELTFRILVHHASKNDYSLLFS